MSIKTDYEYYCLLSFLIYFLEQQSPSNYTQVSAVANEPV